MKANNIQLTRACDADPKDINAAMKELDPNWKWHSSAELRHMIENNELNADQLKAVDHVASTVFDEKGHIVDPELKAFYEAKWQEHNFSKTPAGGNMNPNGDSTITPTEKDLTADQLTQQVEEEEKTIIDQNPQDPNSEHLTTPEPEEVQNSFTDSTIQKMAAVQTFGTQENPSITLQDGKTIAAYETTNEDGNIVRHTDEYKGGKFLDKDMNGEADEVKIRRQLASNEVVSSSDGKVLETTHQEFRRGGNGLPVLQNEVKMDYSGDHVVQTETDCYLNGSQKSVTVTEFMEGTNDKPLTVTEDRYIRNSEEPYETFVTKYDEFTGEKLLTERTNHETGGNFIHFKANPTEIYNKRAEVLTSWQKQASTMDQSSAEFTALSDKISRLESIQKITATQNSNLKISVGAGRNG